jgi:hypothetical protein
MTNGTDGAGYEIILCAVTTVRDFPFHDNDPKTPGSTELQE